MNEQEMDNQIRDCFAKQQLAEAGVQRILEAGRQAAQDSKQGARPIYWGRWAAVAAAACVVMFFSFQLGLRTPTAFEEEVAGEIAMRHNSFKSFQVASHSFEGVQAGLKNLAFSVQPLIKHKLLSAYEIIGARYCQLEGQQAAHLQVKHRGTGKLCTLYIAAMKGPLMGLASTEQSVALETHDVDLWQDTDRLFALVK